MHQEVCLMLPKVSHVVYVPYLCEEARNKSLLDATAVVSITHLHEEACDKGLPDVDVVVSACEVCRRALQVESVHDSSQLLPHVVR